jgi:hypothetical protein
MFLALFPATVHAIDCHALPASPCEAEASKYMSSQGPIRAEVDIVSSGTGGAAGAVTITDLADEE